MSPITQGYPGFAAGASGEVDGSTSAEQLPSVPCQLAWIKALESNAGQVYIGFAGVTVAAGTLDTTSGFELSAGEVLGPLPISNLNLLYFIADAATDDFCYFTLG